MNQISKFPKKFIRQMTLTVVVTFLICSSVLADVLKLENVLFVGENNGSNRGYSWTQLEFRIQKPAIGNKSYFRSSISFTIDADRKRLARTDLRFARDWLQSYKWSSRPGKDDIYLGSGQLSASQLSDLRQLSPDEKIIAAWIIANSDELIEFALNDKRQAVPVASRSIWNQLSKNDFFEKNIRKNLGRHFGTQLANYDKSIKDSKFVLEKQIQPYLKSLKLYDGKIDGLWGEQTLQGIKKFERSVGLFPDGVLTYKERILLRDTAQAVDKYSNPTKVKELVENLNERIKDHTDMLRVEREKSKAKLLKMSELQTTLNKRIAEVSKAKRQTF